MNFKIDKRLGAIGVRSDGASLVTPRSDSAETKGALNRKQEAAAKEDLDSFGEGEAAKGASLVVGNIKNALSTAEDAIADIISLRERQEEITREAAAGPHSSKNSVALDQEANNLNAKIRDIRTNARYNGRNPLESTTYSVSTSAGELRNAVATGAVSLHTGSYSIKNATNADTSLTKIENDLTSLRSSQAGFGAAADKTPKFVRLPKEEETFAVKDQRPNALESVEEAQSLANSVAQKVGSALGDEQSTSRLIESSTEGLDLDRVKDLLS